MSPFPPGGPKRSLSEILEDRDEFLGDTDDYAKSLLSDAERFEIESGLPHLFAFGWYDWAREFFESKNRFNLLCAANQASKSSTQIRKALHWATETELWAELWPDTIKAGQIPNQFWYLYPSQKVVDAEWKTKWSQFLPRGRFKDDPKYGWKVLKDGSHVIGIEFKSGVTLFFKTYSQKIIDLQSGSVFALFCDEELPMQNYDELIFRITATRGYFHMVFTATLGQEFWRIALEPLEHEVENLVGAWKRQVSLYECMFYEDGTPSGRKREDIEALTNLCSTHDEIARRIWGKFITPLEGRKYPTFDARRHYCKPHPIPSDWEIYVGVDVGSGNEPGSDREGHPSAIMFLAVDPKYTQGRFFTGWRGDNIGSTIADDVMQKYREICRDRKLVPLRKFYDQACRDFKTISERLGATDEIAANFEPAEKSHDIGDELLNLLFKHDMLKLFDDDLELQKFGREIATIKKSTPKSKRKDDMVDAGRYAVTSIIWDLERLNKPFVAPLPEIKEETPSERDIRLRRERAQKFRDRTGYTDQLGDEIREINSLLEDY